MRIKILKSPFHGLTLCCVLGLSLALFNGCEGTTTGDEPDPNPTAEPASEPDDGGEPDATPEPSAGPGIQPNDGGSEQCPQLSPISSPVGEACATEGQTCPSCLAPGPNCLDLVCRSGIWTQGQVAPGDGGTTGDADAGDNDAGNGSDAGAAGDAGSSDAG